MAGSVYGGLFGGTGTAICQLNKGNVVGHAMAATALAVSAVAQYGDQDEFLGPDGEIMAPARDADGEITPAREVSAYGDRDLGKT